MGVPLLPASLQRNTMRLLLSNLLILQIVVSLATPVFSLPSTPDEAQHIKEVNSRVTETLQAARKLRDSQRQLLTCSESLPKIQEVLGDGAITSCECLEIEGTDSSIVNCQDFCKLCRDEWNLCVTYEFAFNFIQGDLQTFVGRLQYSGSRNDKLEFEERYSGDGVDVETCTARVNDVQCTSCAPSTGSCDDGVVYDCTNIETGAFFDECEGDFQEIPETSVFVAYNVNFFNDGDCIFFPTQSPVPTLTPLPTREPETNPTDLPTRPALVTLPLRPFRIGIEYESLDDVEFSNAILDYITAQLNKFFPDLVGVVLDRIEPNGPIPPNEVMFLFEGEAFFLGNAPNQLALEAAQKYLLRDLVFLQQAITANDMVGREVFVVVVLIAPETFEPTPAPTPAPTRKPGYYHKHPWYFHESKSKMSMKSKKGKKSPKKMMKHAKHHYANPPSPPYPAHDQWKMAPSKKMGYNDPPTPMPPPMAWKNQMGHMYYSPSSKKPVPMTWKMKPSAPTTNWHMNYGGNGAMQWSGQMPTWSNNKNGMGGTWAMSREPVMTGGLWSGNRAWSKNSSDSTKMGTYSMKRTSSTFGSWQKKPADDKKGFMTWNNKMSYGSSWQMPTWKMSKWQMMKYSSGYYSKMKSGKKYYYRGQQMKSSKSKEKNKSGWW